MLPSMFVGETAFVCMYVMHIAICYLHLLMAYNVIVALTGIRVGKNNSAGRKLL